MTLPTRGQALGVLGAVCLAFIIGRGTQKTITVEKIREVEHRSAEKTEELNKKIAKATEDLRDLRQHWKTTTRSTCPDGGKGAIETVQEVDSEDKGKASTKETVYVDRVIHDKVFVDREKLVAKEAKAAPPGLKWSVGAAAGVDVQGRLRYGGELGRHLVGGLWFTAGVDVPTRAATLGLRLEF